MPPTLHPHLKRGLDFDDFHTDRKDIIELPQADCQDPEVQAAKRRRVEAIALQYLRGRPPIILSAGLRGPFTHGWRNPWAKDIPKARKTKDNERGTADQRNVPGTDTTDQRVSNAKARDRKKKTTVVKHKAPRLASPEAPRAAKDDLEDYERDESLDGVEVPLATAPLQDEHDASGATEFFNASTKKCTHRHSLLTNPFWLRRPESEGELYMNSSTVGDADASPTRSRSRNGNSQCEASDDLQLALPKVALRSQCSPPNTKHPEYQRPSASASVIVSSPMKKSTLIQNSTAANAQAQPDQTSRATVTVQGQSAQLTSAHVDVLGAISVLQGTHAIVFDTASGAGFQRSTFRDASTTASTGSDMKMTVAKPLQNAARHDLVASPIPASSTGFIYRKVGGPKRTGTDAPRAKTPSVDINSISSNQKNAPASEKQSSRCIPAVEAVWSAEEGVLVTGIEGAEGTHARSSEETTAKSVEGAGAALVNIVQEEQLEVSSSGSSRNSTFSTQAAMLLARIEFQESSSPPIPSEDPRPWSQPQHDTPQAMLPERSPAITPISVFGAQLDRSLSTNSVFRELPISTQDLFGAASPFAFSTVKKKPEVVHRSSVRFPRLPGNNAEPRANNTPAKNPAASVDRIPLKAKNTSTPLWSFVSEKTSQASQRSLTCRSGRSITDDRLPQLDFHTSLDDFAPNGSLHLTDQLLCDINDR